MIKNVEMKKFIRPYSGCGGLYVGRPLLLRSPRFSRHPLAARKRMRLDGATESLFDTQERRVIGKKIVNVEYHKIDWATCFRCGGSND